MLAAEAATTSAPAAVVHERGGAPLPQSSPYQGLSAKFLGHLTHTESDVVPPGTPLVKAWRVRNEGTAPWPAGTLLACVSSKPEGWLEEALCRAGNAAALRGVPVPPAEPGACVDIAVPLMAPAQPGRYMAYFRFLAPVPSHSRGFERFGHVLWTQLFVEPPQLGTAPLGAHAAPALGLLPVLRETLVPARVDEGGEAGTTASPPAVTPFLPRRGDSIQVSDGSALASDALVAAAGGSTDATAVLAALTGAPQPTAVLGLGEGALPPLPDASAAEVAAASFNSLPPPPDRSGPWAGAAAMLASMGFLDELRNAALLARYDGSIERALHELL
jgi:hypothetical protein